MNQLDFEIENALREPQEIAPSAFFTRRVMAAVRAEADPGPLPFPWKRVVAGVVFLLIVIASAMGTPEAPPSAGWVVSLPALAAVLLVAAAATFSIAIVLHNATPPHRR